MLVITQRFRPSPTATLLIAVPALIAIVTIGPSTLIAHHAGPDARLLGTSFVQGAMSFQSMYNFWPEPVRKHGVSYPPKGTSMLTPTADDTVIGSSLTEEHHFYTKVAAISIVGNLYVYGKAGFGGSDAELRSEVMMLHMTEDFKNADESLRFVEYFTQEADDLVRPAALQDSELISGATLQTELTAPPTEPPNQVLMARLRACFTALAVAYGSGDAAQKLLQMICDVSATTVTLPLQQVTASGRDFASEWGAGLGGPMKLLDEAYAGHHPDGFLLFELGGKKGVLVAEMDEGGKTLQKVIVFRDFVSDSERAAVLK